MNQEMEQFERRLSRQPLRQVPPEWREEILAAAGRESKVESRAPKRLWSSSLVLRLSSVFWPHPVAWAGLAAVWMFIFAMEFSLRDRVPVVAENSAAPPVEVMVAVRQQQRLLAELLEPRESRVADRQKVFLPRPRSEHAEMLTA